MTTTPLPSSFGQHLAETRAALNAQFDSVLSEIHADFIRRPSLRPIWKALRAFLINEGKRVRPLLFLSTYHLFEQEKDDSRLNALYRVGCGLEIFHAFALIHDDIIDASLSRRGQPTMHLRIENEFGLSHENSRNLALVMGDILFGYAMELLASPDLPPERVARAIRYFAGVARDTGLGEGVEIIHLEKTLDEVTEDEILQTYYLKTTRYTIEGPMVLGAILAGAPESSLHALQRFAYPLGLAFQIENDLHELSLNPDDLVRLANDIRMGVKTLAFKKLHQALDNAERVFLENFMRNPLPVADLPRLCKVIQSSGIHESLSRETSRFFQEAALILEASPLEDSQKAGLSALVAFVDNNSHHSEAFAPKARRAASR